MTPIKGDTQRQEVVRCAVLATPPAAAMRLVRGGYHIRGLAWIYRPSDGMPSLARVGTETEPSLLTSGTCCIHNLLVLEGVRSTLRPSIHPSSSLVARCLLRGGWGPGTPGVRLNLACTAVLLQHAGGDASLRWTCSGKPYTSSAAAQQSQTIHQGAQLPLFQALSRALWLRGHYSGGCSIYCSAGVPSSGGIAGASPRLNVDRAAPAVLRVAAPAPVRSHRRCLHGRCCARRHQRGALRPRHLILHPSDHTGARAGGSAIRP